MVNFGPYSLPSQSANKYAYTFEGTESDSSPKATEAPKKKMDPNLVKKYVQIIKELKDHSQYSPSSEGDNKLWEEQLEKIYDLQISLESSAQPIQPMESYQLSYTNYKYNMSQIENFGIDLPLIVKHMFGAEVANKEQMFFVPDIEYLKKVGQFFKKTDKK